MSYGYTTYRGIDWKFNAADGVVTMQIIDTSNGDQVVIAQLKPDDALMVARALVIHAGRARRQQSEVKEG